MIAQFEQVILRPVPWTKDARLTPAENPQRLKVIDRSNSCEIFTDTIVGVADWLDDNGYRLNMLTGIWKKEQARTG